MTRIYLPLRSSVELFRDPESPEPVTRAKQAAVLYDEVVFEDGLLDASLTHDGSFVNYMPRGMFTEDDLRFARTVYPEGSGFRVEATVNPGSTDPSQPEVLIPAFEGEFTGKYAAEWYTGVIEELQHFRPPWAKAFQMDDERLIAVGLTPIIEEVARSVSTVDLTNLDAIRKAFLVQSFSRDATVASSLQASVHVTSLFEPLLAGASELGLRRDASGEAALGVVVPDVGALTWEEISAFREHPGSDEARTKLREVEVYALDQEPEDAFEFQARVAREVTDLLFAVIDDMGGTVTGGVAREAANVGISFIPFVGPILGPGVSMVETVHERIHNRRSWYAALMKLRTPR
jgi:hypothetical protein